jgi:hypothetical protein
VRAVVIANSVPRDATTDRRRAVSRPAYTAPPTSSATVVFESAADDGVERRVFESAADDGVERRARIQPFESRSPASSSSTSPVVLTASTPRYQAVAATSSGAITSARVARALYDATVAA